MSEETEHYETGSQAEPMPEPQPVLSDDGIGITLDEARTLLAIKHQSVVGIDDPILMVVTLNNAFLNQQEKLFKKHQEALTALMSAESSKFVSETNKVMHEIKNITASAVVKEAKLQIERITKLRRDMIWLSAVMFISAFSIIFTFAFFKS